MFLRGLTFIALGLLFLLPFENSFAQETARTVDQYIDRGGFQAYELGDTDDNIHDVLNFIYENRGDYFRPDVILYTQSHSFKGKVIQVTDRYVVLLDYVRTGPRNAAIEAMHVVERNDIVAVTASGL